MLIEGHVKSRPVKALEGEQIGIVYLLHFNELFKHARHYVGFCSDLPNRLRRHRQGRSSKLMHALFKAGIGFECVLSKIGTRRQEKGWKHWRGGRKILCPKCNPEGLTLDAKRKREIQ